MQRYFCHWGKEPRYSLEPFALNTSLVSGYFSGNSSHWKYYTSEYKNNFWNKECLFGKNMAADEKELLLQKHQGIASN